MTGACLHVADDPCTGTNIAVDAQPFASLRPARLGSPSSRDTAGRRWTMHLGLMTSLQTVTSGASSNMSVSTTSRTRHPPAGHRSTRPRRYTTASAVRVTAEAMSRGAR